MELGDLNPLMRMIVGHGIDIEELASIESAVTRHEGFAKRVLTAKEMERFNSPQRAQANRIFSWSLVG